MILRQLQRLLVTEMLRESELLFLYWQENSVIMLIKFAITKFKDILKLYNKSVLCNVPVSCPVLAIIVVLLVYKLSFVIIN